MSDDQTTLFELLSSLPLAKQQQLYAESQYEHEAARATAPQGQWLDMVRATLREKAEKALAELNAKRARS